MRTNVDDRMFDQMVATELMVVVGEGNPFTGYHVTMKLREAYPGIDISHPRANAIVRRIMESQFPQWLTRTEDRETETGVTYRVRVYYLPNGDEASDSSVSIPQNTSSDDVAAYLIQAWEF